MAISVFPNFRMNSQKFGNFCFPEILVTIRNMKRRVYMPSTGHVTRLFSTTAAALRARHPGAAAQKRHRRAAAARRLETERERERIRTVRRRVYVPSIGHLFPPFLYDRRRSEGLTARRCCAKTKPRAAARRFTAEERERERERERKRESR